MWIPLILVVGVLPTMMNAIFVPESIFVSKPTIPVTTNRTIYVPLGRNYVLECDALKAVIENDLSKLDVGWKILLKNITTYKFAAKSIDDRWRVVKEGKYLRGYVAVKAHEGYYECHVFALDQTEWASRTSLVIQDCGTEENELKAYNHKRNPCKYGACTIEPFPQAPVFERLKCNCVTQYTGEFCDVLVKGALIREIINFSPFIGHMLAFLFVFIFYFCCRHGGSKPKISLLDEVPEVPRTVDDPKMLYPAALLPEIEEEQHEEELDAFAVTKLLKELQKS